MTPAHARARARSYLGFKSLFQGLYKAVGDVQGIAGTYGYDGRYLRAVRELRKRTIEDIAEETRISLRYLHALESNDFGRLPAETFVRGYVKELIRALKVDDANAVEGYLELYRQRRG